MSDWKRLVPITIILSALGCAAPGPTRSDGAGGGSAPGGRGAVKRIVIGTTIEADIRPGGVVGQSFAILLALIQPGLSLKDPEGVRRPVLAESVPSLENGLWKVFPDGRMETTWKLRAGAQWHDGVPFTADDLLFSLRVGRDPELVAFQSVGYAEIDEVAAPDASTLTITWKRPYIEADALYAHPGALRPLPRHLLEGAYREDKVGFLDLPYWTQDFVGTGPYRVREWTIGVGVRLEANGEFVLGRPKIDEVELRHIPDANTLSANLLAGAVDVTSLLPLDLGLQLREQWRDGTVIFNLGDGRWTFMVPQLIDPHPAVVGELRFRRALVHAIDRQEMADTILGGLSPVPHSMLEPNQAAYREIEASIPRSDYHPRRAAELLQELGYAKGPDDAYRDAAGQRLEVEVRTSTIEEHVKAGAAIADYWQRLGVGATTARVAPQRVQDLEYVATFPAFLVRGVPIANYRRYHSSGAQLPSNNFRAGADTNFSRYMNPELDALIDTYHRTVPMAERTQMLGQIARHMADQVTIIGLAYQTAPGAISKRLLNVGTQWPGISITWNAHEWYVR